MKIKTSQNIFLILFMLLSSPLGDAGVVLIDVEQIIQHHMVPRVMAKEVCSCLYNSRLPLETCRKKTGLPNFTTKAISINFKDEDNIRSVIATAQIPSISRRVFYRAIAIYNREQPQLGCRLIFND